MKNFRYNLRKAVSIATGAIRGNATYAYWWNDQPNFGDLLTPELLHYFGRTPIHRYPMVHRREDWSVVGSLLHMLPPDYCGNILGSGLIRDMTLRLPHAQIWSVRGDLTKRAMDLPENTPTGDLGLLADCLVPKRQRKSHVLGLIPHFVDKEDPWVTEFVRRYRDQVLLIDVERSARAVVSDIAQCESIASSSLHGIIVADSFGIPNVWLGISDAVIGSGFKFRDYFSSISTNQSQVPTKTLETIEDVQNALVSKDGLLIDEKKRSIETLVRRALRTFVDSDNSVAN